MAIIVDHPERDLAGVVLTAFELCQRGVICYLVPHNLQDREIFALAPDLVLLNYLRRSNDEFARRMMAAGIRFGLTDSEGGVWPDLESYEDLLWTDDSLLEHLRCICMWGPRLAEFLIRKGRFRTEQVFVTGCARFDFYEDPWRRVLSNGAPSHPREWGRILINTNYYVSNSRYADVQTNQAQLRHYGWSEERVAQIVADEARAIDETIPLARRLAESFPRARVILRPHPFERPERYATALSDRDNIDVDPEGPVQAQLFRASVVVQRSCTTAIEAGLAGVPTVSPQWIPAPMLMPMAEAVSVPAATYTDLESLVGSVLDGTYQPPIGVVAAIEGVVAEWFFRRDGRSHERVCDAVTRELEAFSRIDERLCTRFAYGIERGMGWRLVDVGRRIRLWAGLPALWSFRWMRRIEARNTASKHFGPVEVRALASRIQNVRVERGDHVLPVQVARARDRGDYLAGYDGLSVTMARAS